MPPPPITRSYNERSSRDAQDTRRSRYPEDRSGNSVDVNQHRSEDGRSSEQRNSSRNYYETSDGAKHH